MGESQQIKEKKPKISICIPVYNVEKYVERCIKSILEQDFQDYEVIIVNDATPDKSFEIVKELTKNDSRFILIDKKENEGIMQVRRDAYLIAKGVYITFIDSDDFYEKDALSIMYDAISNSDVDIVEFSYKEYNNSKIINKSIIPYSLKGPDIINGLLEKKITLYLWNKIFKRELFENNNFTCLKKHNAGDDLLLLSEVFLKTKKITGINKVTYGYIIHENSISRSKPDPAKLTYINLLKIWYNRIKDHSNIDILNDYFIRKIMSLGIRFNNFSKIREKLGDMENLFSIHNFKKIYGKRKGYIYFNIYYSKIPVNFYKIISRGINKFYLKNA